LLDQGTSTVAGVTLPVTPGFPSRSVRRLIARIRNQIIPQQLGVSRANYTGSLAPVPWLHTVESATVVARCAMLKTTLYSPRNRL